MFLFLWVPSPSPVSHYLLLSISCRTRQSCGQPMQSEQRFSWTLPWQRGGAAGRRATRRPGGTRTFCSPCTSTRRGWTRATRQQVSVCLSVFSKWSYIIESKDEQLCWSRKVNYNSQGTFHWQTSNHWATSQLTFHRSVDQWWEKYSDLVLK